MNVRFSLSYVEKWHVQVPVFVIIYRHVTGPVTLNALDEVFHGFIYVMIHIIWTPKFNLLKGKARFANEWRTLRADLDQDHLVWGVLTLIFSAMISGSSQIDSTKNTCINDLFQVRSDIHSFRDIVSLQHLYLLYSPSPLQNSWWLSSSPWWCW